MGQARSGAWRISSGRGVVFGRGRGTPAVVVGSAPVFIGPGTQHWATIHVDDLAELSWKPSRPTLVEELDSGGYPVK